MTAQNACGFNTATVGVIVSGANAPTVDPIAAQSVTSGNAGSFAVTGSDPNVPAATPLTFTATQTGTTALTVLTVAQNGPTGANVSYTAPTGITSPTDITVSVTATNSASVASAPVSTTVTINPAVVAGVAPVANAGGPYTVSAGGTVTLAGTATGTSPLNFLWTAPSAGSLSSLNVANPVYTAPIVNVDTTVNVTLTVINGTAPDSTAIAQVTVKAALAPTVNPVVPFSLFSGANGSFTITGADPNLPAALVPLNFSVANANPTVISITNQVRLTPTSVQVNFTAPILPFGQVTSSVANLTITATNSVGVVSAPVTTTVTVNPVPDAVAITNAEFRTGKQRLIITASSSVISPSVVLKLQPYVTTTGSTFNPASSGVDTFTNGGGGLYTITIVGAPMPGPGPVLVVRSNLGGVSPAHALDRIRL